MLTLLKLLAALALLVWGTQLVKNDVLALWGPQLRRVLSTRVSGRLPAFGSGLGVTALVQSSNATALLVCGFVAQGLLALPVALAIMLGADVGTALMAGVLSLDVAWLAPAVLLAGALLHLPRPQTRAGHVGRAVIGLGLVLLALQLVGEATEPLTQAAGMKVLYASLTGDVVLDVVAGALLAVLTYSSLAAVLVAATLAGSGVVTLQAGWCLVIGANLGSAVLMAAAASRQDAAARRVALGSGLFRLAGAALVVPFIGPLAQALPHAGPWLHGTAAMQVIGFHIAYNTLRSLASLPFVAPMARLCTRWLPDPRPSGVPDPAAPRRLDLALAASPSLALGHAVREVLRLGEIVETMLAHLLPVLRDNDLASAAQARRLDDDVDRLYTALKLYLAGLSRQDLTVAQRRRCDETLALTINLEQAGDIVERLVKELEARKIAKQRSFSDAGLAEVCELHQRLLGSLQRGLSVYLHHDERSARQLLAAKSAFNALEREYARRHLARLAGQAPQSVETSALHLDLISDMKRLHSLFCAPAYAVLDHQAQGDTECEAPASA
jgi:phosphate:Na+ symporter